MYRLVHIRIYFQELLRSIEEVNNSLNNVSDNIFQMNNIIEKSINRLQETESKTSHIRDHLNKLEYEEYVLIL